jgi:hypothetical protein
MLPHLPLILTGHVDKPILQQFVAFPGAMPQRRLTPPHGLRPKPTCCQGTHHRTTAPKKPTLPHHPQEVHQRNIYPDRRRLHDRVDCMNSMFYGD